MGRTQKLAVRVAAGSSLLLLVLGGVLGGRYGLEGSFIGLTVGIWTIGTLAILAHAVMRDRLKPRDGVIKTLLAGVLKLPITLLLLYVGTTLPSPGLGCFLGGIGLVYSCTAWYLAGANLE